MSVRSVLKVGALVVLGACTSGCDPFTRAVIGTTVGGTILGAQSPNSEIQQIYYLGVFDPQEQVPPTVYRVRVHGQASFISFTRFASGWVPASLVDSLSSNIGFAGGKSEEVKIAAGEGGEFEALKPGRRLIMFGPEGFREAPKNHRLVVVMGTSPEDFFKAIDTSLGVVAEVMEEQKIAALDRELFELLTRIKSEREALAAAVAKTEAELPAKAGAK